MGCDPVRLARTSISCVKPHSEPHQQRMLNQETWNGDVYDIYGHYLVSLCCFGMYFCKLYKLYGSFDAISVLPHVRYR